MAMRMLEDKFVYDLADIYDAEHRFLEAQQEMLQHARAPQLQMMLQEHIAQTQEQIQNLERIYAVLGAPPARVTCEAAAGLVKEGQKGMQEFAANPAVRDCMISGAIAKVEHYEIASYRGLVTAFQGVGQHEILSLLSQNLNQEEQTAQKVESSLPMLLDQAMLARQQSA
ncbi:MAG: ferritin-like domain-containing protein [Oscillochloris sp.]|nr:ferritin-like domain-containing protein [Oscillochloris sp.]